MLLTGWNFFQPIRSTTKIWVVHVISMEFLRSLLRRHFARAQVAASRNVSCFLLLLQECFCNSVSSFAGGLYDHLVITSSLSCGPNTSSVILLSENCINLNTHQSKQRTTFGVPHSYQCFWSKFTPLIWPLEMPGGSNDKSKHYL